MDFYQLVQALHDALHSVPAPASSRRIGGVDHSRVRAQRIHGLICRMVDAGWEELARQEKKGSFAQFLLRVQDIGERGGERGFSQEDEARLKTLLEQVRLFPSSSPLALPQSVPFEIRHELRLDLKEMERCYHAQAYRSTMILAARMLEVSLHRKYYQVTGKDILATNPEIGLGKLIAKLAEHKVTFDPGLLNQIHLLNAVRIHAVHKKQDIYTPTREQAKAMLLLTVDILRKLFG